MTVLKHYFLEFQSIFQDIDNLPQDTFGRENSKSILLHHF